MNKNILIAILVVVIIGVAAFAIFSTSTPQKMNTEFDILTDNSLENGDQFQFQLKEQNGSAIAGETVKIGFNDSNGNMETFEVVTDSNGRGALNIENEDSGSHEITLAYDGNDKYNECSLKLSITIEDDSEDSDDSDSTETDISDDNSASSDDSSSNNTLPDNPEHWNYDAETGQYYLDDGTIVGDSQWSGSNIEDLRKLGQDPFANIT